MNRTIITLLALCTIALSAIGQTSTTTTTNTTTTSDATITTVTTTTVITNAPITAPSVTNPPPKNPWDASLALGLTLTRGISKTLLFSGTFDADKKWDKNELHFGAAGVYGEQTVETTTGTTTSSHNDVTADSINGFGQYNRLFTERLYGYARVEGLYDRIAGIDYRLTISPGLGYYLIKNTNTMLRAEVGPGFVWEQDAASGTNGISHQSYYTLRFAEKFEQKLSEHAKFWEGVEYLPQVDNFENYIINAEVGIESSMTKKLSLQAVLQDSYRNDPTPGKLPNDLRLIAGVKYKF